MKVKNLLTIALSRYKEERLENPPTETDEQRFRECYEGWKASASNSYKHIPKFYSKAPASEHTLQQKLREDARALFLQHRGEELLDNEELKHLYAVLDRHQTPPAEEDKHYISYDDYKKVRDLVGVKMKPYLTEEVFAKLYQNDPYGRVLVLSVFNYVMRKVWLHQTRIGLSLYDISGQGFLRESDIENYITELMPTLPQLHGLETSFYSFYLCTAVRKFFFFLDPMRTGKIRIHDILACSFLDDLLELRDEDLRKDLQESNWFSAPSALRVYGIYLNLDKDHNGMLSQEELSRYGTGTLTNVFIERVFQECLTYDGEMDYKTYLDFILALENMKETQSLQYFFRVLDINHQGYLDLFTLSYFFRAIQDQMRTHGQEPVVLEDVSDEIFDMVRPADPTKITFKDLVKSGQGDTVVSILIDLNGFWTYENRETLVSDTGEDGSDL